MISRRRFFSALGLGGVALWVWAAPQLPQLWRRDLAFTPIASAPPFRRLNSTGTSSALNAVFAGLKTPTHPDVDLCRHLFDGSPTGIAIFSDANCPNCPEMNANVQAAAAGSELSITHKVLPILGPTSEFAAKATIASLRQKSLQGFRDGLAGSVAVPTPSLIYALAAEHGADVDQLQADMQSPQTTQRIATDRALAAQLGLIGTPATVIGRTILFGSLPERTIRQIIAMEQDLDPPCA